MTDQTTTTADTATLDTTPDTIDVTTLPRPQHPKVTARLSARQGILRKLLAVLGYVPTIRVATDLLKKQGIQTGNGTVHRDYLALGLSSSRTLPR